jgi:homoserine O-acetyltransferase
MLAWAALLLCVTFVAAGRAQTTPHEGEYTIEDFHFAAGGELSELKLHYRTLGWPVTDAAGHVRNAVLILHGTGGTGRQFLSEQFADVLFQPGQPLDAGTHFIILPDGIGHGGSSKPSDGMRMRFPHYGYIDMVHAEHALVHDGLHVDHLRLVMGTSMGCMHSFLWGEMYPDEMDALMPLACLPVAISGRNRMWRRAAMDAIEKDPSWRGGNYTAQPAGLRAAMSIELIAVTSPLQWQKLAPDGPAADRAYEKMLDARVGGVDANDLLYQLDSSRDYNPEPGLGKIQAALTLVNSADDFVNPPELDIAPREMKRVARGRFVLIPISDETRGHGTHTRAVVWKQYLMELLNQTKRQ